MIFHFRDHLILSLVISAGILLLTCSPLTSDNTRSGDLSPSGMKKIVSSGRSFEQGWNGSQATLDERPGMRSGFTYDFWLDSTEVTQKDYSEVTGKRPVAGGTKYGIGDEYPVYYVSWFDAVLYCNARSKVKSLDTVYSYAGVNALPNGTVYELTGVRYDLSRDGYRLPTESEWEYAARGGSTTVLATKTLVFWNLCDSLEIAITGSSQMNWGFNPAMITGFKTFNLAAISCGLLGQKHFILDYIIRQGSKMKMICSNLDIYMLVIKGGDGDWSRCFGQSKGYEYDSCHNFWDSGVTKEFKDIINQIPLPSPSDTSNRGFVGLPSEGWGTDPPPFDPTTFAPWDTWDTTDPNYRQNLTDIINVADMAKSRGIHWLVILVPVSPKYNQTARYCAAGPSWPTAHAIIRNLQTIENSNKYFHFYNANNDGVNDYVYEDFHDEYHLSAKGADKLSRRVDSIIHTILP